MAKQNLTVRLETTVLRSARRLAVQRHTSISALVAGQIEKLVGEHSAYERAKRLALARLEIGLPGSFAPASRASLHDRENLR